MGLFASQLWDGMMSYFQPPARLLMLGLDNAGKSIIMYKLKLNEVTAQLPTIGFNVETLKVGKGLTFTVWDIGGQTTIRPLWRHFFQGAQGLVYVIDSTDHERIKEPRDELFDVIDSDELRGIPVLVFANKQDQPRSMSIEQIMNHLGLREIKHHKWEIQASCAVNGQRLCEGIYCLANMVKQFKKQTKSYQLFDGIMINYHCRYLYFSINN